MKIETILSNFKIGKGGVVFAIDKDSHTFVYHPNEKLIEKDAEKEGITNLRKLMTIIYMRRFLKKQSVETEVRLQLLRE